MKETILTCESGFVVLGAPDVVEGIKIGCGITLPKTKLIHLGYTKENKVNIEMEITYFLLIKDVLAFNAFENNVQNCRQL